MRVKNVKLTARFAIQLLPEAIDTPLPRISLGNISAIMVHTNGPKLAAKAAIYPARAIRIRILKPLTCWLADESLPVINQNPTERIAKQIVITALPISKRGRLPSLSIKSIAIPVNIRLTTPKPA